MKYKKLAIIIILFIACSLSSFAQGSGDMRKGIQMAQQKQWVQAEKIFADIAKAQPKNGRAWYLLGLMRHNQKKFELAISALEKSLSLLNNPIAMYKIATAHAQLKRKDEAFTWLEKAIKRGANVSNGLKNDGDLSELRSDARFKEISTLMERRTKPCMFSKESRQFDFWIGEWDVFLGKRKIGENSVKREASGCVLTEDWTGTGGQSGKALNSYDVVTKKWKQFYVLSNNNILEFQGEFQDNTMRFEGTTIGPKGEKVLNIVENILQKDKSVRQIWKTSNDEGKTWQTIWDAKFVKKKSEQK